MERACHATWDPFIKQATTQSINIELYETASNAKKIAELVVQNHPVAPPL